VKVPKGKIVYAGGKKYAARAELPDDVAARVGLEVKAPAPKSTKRAPTGSGEAEKPRTR